MLGSVLGHHSLLIHPDTPSRSIDAVGVVVERCDDHFFLVFQVVHGGTLKVPPFAAPKRTDGLWNSTCFELFCWPQGADGYRELNFSPTTQWAAYSFDAYRKGMRELELACPPEIAITNPAGGGHFWLEVDGVYIACPASGCRIGLSAVIEEIDGTKSYWALAHPPGKPDFHHPACFAATLAAPPAA